jgi:hypothetical protein
MNKIYRYQPVIIEGPFGTDYRPSGTETQQPTELCFLDGYRYISTDINETIIPEQITLEEVELTSELIETIKTASPHTQLVASRVIEKIRTKYPLDEELYFARIAVGALQGSYTLLPGEAEALQQYQIDVEAAREWGRQERANLGL